MNNKGVCTQFKFYSLDILYLVAVNNLIFITKTQKLTVYAE